MDTKNDPMYPRLNRTIYQLQRIVSNMSDASLLLSTAPNLTECDICSPFREALEKATVLLKHAGIELKYSVPAGAIRGFAERDLISRAVYNLLSNAVKYAQAGEKLTAELTQKGKLLCFTVTGGQCKEPAAQEQFFKGYAREPGIAGYPSGLGLGITIVHTAASAHGGTVLVQQTPGQSTRVTMTLQIEKTGSSETVRTSILIPDSYGGRDSALVELSDVLPSSLYSGEF